MKDSTKNTIDNYINKGWRPGDFIFAALMNDLTTAAAHADAQNARDLHEIAQYIYWEVPSPAWRTKDNIEEWIRIGGREKVLLHAPKDPYFREPADEIHT